MRRRIMVALLTLVAVFSMSTVAFATDDIPSLNDVAKSTPAPVATQPVQQPTAPDVGAQTQQGANDFMGALQDATKMDTTNEQVEKIGGTMTKIVSMVVQVLSYVLTLGLTIRVVLDLIYIGLPFTRSFLSNGHMGNPQSGQQAPGAMGPMGGGMMGGPGMMGGGGFGGGYGGGMNRFGGGMMGGGMGAMASGMGANPGAMDPGSRMNRIQWVSNAALNAAMSETNVGPDGKPANPFKLYGKDMALVLIVTPALLVLAVTGTLAKLGFVIGSALSNLIGGIGGGL